MKNHEIAKIFRGMATFLEIEKVPFKPQAYERAAFSLESLSEDVGEIYAKGGMKALQEIAGIGKSLAEQIEEYLKSGKIKVHEKFKKELPVAMDELLRVEGLGAKKIKILYEKLRVTDLKSSQVK